MPETENWKILLRPYAEHPHTAVQLAQQLDVLRDFLQQGEKGKRKLIAELNQAIEILFEHSDFRKVGRELFEQKIAGNIKPKQEDRLRELGVKF